jgi:hypothetical protein
MINKEYFYSELKAARRKSHWVTMYILVVMATFDAIYWLIFRIYDPNGKISDPFGFVLSISLACAISAGVWFDIRSFSRNKSLICPHCRKSLILFGAERHTRNYNGECMYCKKCVFNHTPEQIMTTRNYTAKLKDRDVKISSHALAAFREMYLPTSDLTTRMSELLWFDIYVLNAAFGVSPNDILSSIMEVEQGEAPSGVKPATRFNKLPLKGLWHKHYFSAHFVPTNIVLGLGKDGVEKLVNEIMAQSSSPIITQEMIDEFAHRVTHDPIEKRDDRKKLTGEWVVYLPHDGKNYFLCCSTHEAGDQAIYDRIKEHCVRDFPEILAWIKAEQT